MNDEDTLPSDTELLDWLAKHVTETYLRPETLGSDCQDTRCKYMLPSLVSYADYCGQVGFREAIWYAMRQQTPPPSASARSARNRVLEEAIKAVQQCHGGPVGAGDGATFLVGNTGNAIGAIQALKTPDDDVEPELKLDVTLSTDETDDLRCLLGRLGSGVSYDAIGRVRFRIGEIRDVDGDTVTQEYGLLACDADYPEEGYILLKNLPRDE